MVSYVLDPFNSLNEFPEKDIDSEEKIHNEDLFRAFRYLITGSIDEELEDNNKE